MYKFEDSIKYLVIEFAELRRIYEEDHDYYEDLPYVFYESVFVKYIISKLTSQDNKERRKIFDFIELALKNGNEKFKELIKVSVIESLCLEKNFGELKELMSPFWGSLTKECFEKCLTHMNGNVN